MTPASLMKLVGAAMIAGAAATLAPASRAQDGGMAPRADTPIGSTGTAPISRFDDDNDGYISRAEAISERDLVRQFDHLDTNGDGRLDAAEFANLEASGPGRSRTQPAETPEPLDSAPGKPNAEPRKP